MQWFRRHWQAVIGLALLVLPPVWKWTRQVLGVLGDVDLIVERTREPGWVKAVIGLALDPPGWLLLMFVLSGLSIIVWDIFYKPRREHGGRPSPQHQGADFAIQGQKEQQVTETKTNTVTALHSTHQSSPDYASWGRFDDLALFQVACLWAGVEPKKPVPSGEAAARFEMLQRAIWNGELEADLNNCTRQLIEVEKIIRSKQIDRNIIKDDNHVNRLSLIAYAEKIGERPPFLFRGEA
jgi:hypothetical protein